MSTKTLGVFGVMSIAAAIWLVGSTSFAQGKYLKVGSTAPALSATGTDGKTHTLKSLTKEGPIFLYFIKEGCPVNHRAAPFVTKLYGEYDEKARVVGVYNGSEEAAKSWAKRYGAKYLILADPKLTIIRGYGVPYSPFMIVVGKDGKVTKVLEGLSQKELQTANTLMAAACNAKLSAISFEGAPSGGG